MPDDLLIRCLSGRGENLAGGRELSRVGDFGLKSRERRLREPSGRCDGSRAFRSFHRNDVFRVKQVLQHERTRSDEARDLCIAEVTQQTEDIALDRLLPHAFARGEVTCGVNGVDAFIQSGRMQGQHAAFADASDEHGHLIRLCFEPIHHRQRFLHLVADEMATEFVALAVNPLAVRAVRLHAEFVVLAELRIAADQRRNDDFRATAEQKAVHELFRRAGSIRQINHAGRRFAFGLQIKPLAMHAVENGPAHAKDPAGLRFMQQRRRGSVSQQLERGEGNAFIDHAEGRAELFARWLS